MSQSDETSQAEEDPYFNAYTRKVVSYLLAAIFCSVFVFGVLQIYRQFFTSDTQLMEEVNQEIMKKEEKRLTLDQRRQREAKWLNYRTEVIDQWDTDIKYNQEILDMSPIATTVEILQNNDMNYQRAFDELGTIENPIEVKEQEVVNIPTE